MISFICTLGQTIIKAQSKVCRNQTSELIGIRSIQNNINARTRRHIAILHTHRLEIFLLSLVTFMFVDVSNGCFNMGRS
jgi:hypothetical protein